jgi:hypothetical protein
MIIRHGQLTMSDDQHASHVPEIRIRGLHQTNQPVRYAPSITACSRACSVMGSKETRVTNRCFFMSHQICLCTFINQRKLVAPGLISVTGNPAASSISTADSPKKNRPEGRLKKRAFGSPWSNIQNDKPIEALLNSSRKALHILNNSTGMEYFVKSYFPRALKCTISIKQLHDRI